MASKRLVIIFYLSDIISLTELVFNNKHGISLIPFDILNSCPNLSGFKFFSDQPIPDERVKTQMEKTG
jgi:hypothetical protein